MQEPSASHSAAIGGSARAPRASAADGVSGPFERLRLALGNNRHRRIRPLPNRGLIAAHWLLAFTQKLRCLDSGNLARRVQYDQIIRHESAVACKRVLVLPVLPNMMLQN